VAHAAEVVLKVVLLGQLLREVMIVFASSSAVPDPRGSGRL
jgi:hypothetical protein